MKVHPSVLKNLVTSLILYEEIKTTYPRAWETKKVVESLVNLAKKNDLPARRRILGFLFDKKAALKVFEILAPRYQKINSGFVSVYKIGPRLGDAAEQAIVRLERIKVVEDEVILKEKDEEKSTKNEKHTKAIKKGNAGKPKDKSVAKKAPGRSSKN